MFKLGVMSTLIFVLVFLALKGILIGLLILIINVAFVIAKLVAWKSSLHHHEPQIGWYPQKDIHVHIHNSGHEQPHYSHIPISVHGDEYDNHGPYRRIGGSASASASAVPDYYLNDDDKYALMKSWNYKLNRRFL